MRARVKGRNMSRNTGRGRGDAEERDQGLFEEQRELANKKKKHRKGQERKQGEDGKEEGKENGCVQWCEQGPCGQGQESKETVCQLGSILCEPGGHVKSVVSVFVPSGQYTLLGAKMGRRAVAVEASLHHVQMLQRAILMNK